MEIMCDVYWTKAEGEAMAKVGDATWMEDNYSSQMDRGISRPI